MSSLRAFHETFAGKRVLVTGHTGFKGSWLCLWLKELGALVTGYALEPATQPNLFAQAGLHNYVDSKMGDVRDFERLRKVVSEAQPEIVFHLAAQPLVRRSYKDPAETISTNVLGTTYLLEILRDVETVRICQIITSDKCYEDSGTRKLYSESDRLGGRDPYSASKACVELIAASYKHCFNQSGQTRLRNLSLSTVRAGNVIGGGDWAEDRIVPDCIRALSENKKIAVRNPTMSRPWQYVLDALSGYLVLAENQLREEQFYSGPWNFGPEYFCNTTVAELTELIIKYWGSGSWDHVSGNLRHSEDSQLTETDTLNLDCSKAKRLLQWSTVYDIEESVKESVDWYRGVLSNSTIDVAGLMRDQIHAYVKRAAEVEHAWAKPECLA